MKKYQNRSKSKKLLFEAVLSKWLVKQYREDVCLKSRHAVVINAVSAAAVVGLSASAVAQEDAAVMPEVVVTGTQDKEQSYKVNAVSSGKYTEPLRDTPQTISVVSQSVMQEQNSTSLRDVLRNVPGISIQAGEGGVPAGDNLTIRGFSARTDIMIDGVRDFGGYSRDPFNFSQIEVTKGPSSAYAGRGSTGGSVNMVSKAPELEEARSGTLGYGTDMYRRATVDINQPLKADNLPEGSAIRFNALYHGNEAPGRDVAKNERWGIAPSVSFGLDTETRTTLSYFHLDQNNTPDYGIPWVPRHATGPLAAYSDEPAPTDWRHFYGLKDRDYEDVSTDLWTGKIEHDFSDDLSLRNQIRYGQTYRDSIITAPRFAAIATSTDITRSDWKSRDQKSTILDNQTDVTLKVETAGIEHTLVPGLEISRETDINYTRLATGPASSFTGLNFPNWDDAYTENIQRNHARTESLADSVGVYVFDTAKLNEHWELTGGLRFDYFNVDYKAINADGTYGADLGRIDRTVSWRTGIVYKPVEIGSIYAAYGTAFNPSAEGLVLSSITTNVANFALDPEETRTYEIGTKWDLLDEKLALSAAVFRTEKTNARTEDPGNSTDVLVLDGQQHVDGFELGAVGKLTDKWNVTGAYTFMVSEITEAQNPFLVGEELGNTPKNTFSLWSVYELPANFEVGTGVQYVDDRLNNNGSSRIAPSYVIADAMLAYKVNKDLTMRLNAYNLGDAEYISSLSGGHFIPGAGRSATLTSEFKF